MLTFENQSHWFGFLVILGSGMGVGFQAAQTVVQNVLPHELMPQAISNAEFFMTLGGATFVSAGQAVFQNSIIIDMKRHTPQVQSSVVLDAGASELKETLSKLGLSSNTISSILHAYMSGLRKTYAISTSMAVCAFLVALGLRWRRLPKGNAKKHET